jgi:hypothetical protein
MLQLLHLLDVAQSRIVSRARDWCIHCMHGRHHDSAGLTNRRHGRERISSRLIGSAQQSASNLAILAYHHHQCCVILCSSVSYVGAEADACVTIIGSDFPKEILPNRPRWEDCSFCMSNKLESTVHFRLVSDNKTSSAQRRLRFRSSFSMIYSCLHTHALRSAAEKIGRGVA